MKYQVIIPNSVEKDLKRIDRSIAKIIYLEIQNEIAINPTQGKQLNRKHGVLSWKIRAGKTDYRVAYRVDNQNQIVYLLMVKSRENFYKELEKRI